MNIIERRRVLKNAQYFERTLNSKITIYIHGIFKLFHVFKLCKF